MDYTIVICSTISFIEQRVKQEIDFSELEKAIGYSYRHIREIFKEVTNISLTRYITSRKIANAAFEIVFSEKSLTNISIEYWYDSYDTFTRAFKRVTGMTPSDFKKSGLTCGRKSLGMGAYGPFILYPNNSSLTYRNMMEVLTMNKFKKTSDSCVLYGVPKISYGREVDGDMQITPFPMCLQSVLSYMGQNIHYSYLMAASGASFRLRWYSKGWDMAAVDIRNIYENHLKPFELSFKAAGRKFKILDKERSSKNEFIKLIRSEIDEGRPVIALGVVGPPEASIITGYKNNGDTLLGWSLFQNNTEFSNNISFDESGYYICHNWWDNTECVMSIGEEIGSMTSHKELLENALEVLTIEEIKSCQGRVLYGGQAAYRAWSDAMLNDKDFSENTLLSRLIEQMMCFGDATVMVGEGRSYGAGYINWLGSQLPDVEKECIECSKSLKACADLVNKMVEIKGGYIQNETTARKLAEKSVRTEISKLIIQCQQHELKAIEHLKSTLGKL